MNVAIIVPAYNEERNLIKLVKEIKKNISATIIIVDDSTSNSSKKLFKKKKKNLIYIYRGKKLGRGSAVIFGLKKALKIKKISHYIEMDADLSHKPSELKKNLSIFNKQKLDLLIASRYLKKSKIINWPLKRRIFSFLSNKLAKFLLRVNISDYTMGYRIYSRSATKHVVNNCGKIGDGFIVLSEILAELNSNNFSIADIETVFINREKGDSSVNLKLIYESLIGVFKIYFNSRKKL